jgi:hypothetical protein
MSGQHLPAGSSADEMAPFEAVRGRSGSMSFGVNPTR